MKLGFYKFVNEADNYLQAVDKATVDGYDFGDTLLEGVIFIFTVSKKGTLEVEVDFASKDYFNTLNTKQWYEQALKHAKHIDLFDDDVILWDHDKSHRKQKYPMDKKPTFVEVITK